MIPVSYCCAARLLTARQKEILSQVRRCLATPMTHQRCHIGRLKNLAKYTVIFAVHEAAEVLVRAGSAAAAAFRRRAIDVIACAAVGLKSADKAVVLIKRVCWDRQGEKRV